MEKGFTYTLEFGSKKYICPSCSKKTFVKYVNAKGSYASEEFGRCDREDSCGYIRIPENDNNLEPIVRVQKEIKKPSYVDFEDGAKTFKSYDENNLMKFLFEKIGKEKVMYQVERYNIGIDQNTISNRDWVIFFQIDKDNNCRSGKIIRYQTDGKRDRSSRTTWFHSVMKYNDFNLVQCFFGEHLLNEDPRKPIAIVESEKTALIASCFMDKYIWLACGGKGMLGKEKCKVLQNRSVTLFPDLKAYDEWKIKANELGFNISDILERKATTEQKEKGLDLADFLI